MHQEIVLFPIQKLSFACAILCQHLCLEVSKCIFVIAFEVLVLVLFLAQDVACQTFQPLHFGPTQLPMPFQDLCIFFCVTSDSYAARDYSVRLNSSLFKPRFCKVYKDLINVFIGISTALEPWLKQDK